MANDLLDLDSMEVKTPGKKSAMAVAAPDVALDVAIQDQHSPIVAAYIVREISDTALASDFVINTNIANVSPGHGFVNGDVLVIQGYYQGRVLNVATNAITLNQRANLTFPAGSVIKRTQSNMNIDGSSTPQIFIMDSVAGRKFDIYDMRIAFRGSAEMDDAKFASLTALTNGMFVRARINPARYNNYFNARENTEFHLRGELTYNAKAPSGSYGAIFTYRFRTDHGVALRVDTDAGTRLEVIIQDNLAALSYMAGVVHGHVVED